MDETSIFNLNGWGSGNLIEFIVRMAVNLVSIFIFAYFIYYKRQHKKNYFLTLFFLNILVFLVCYSLQSAQLSLGFAFGILAIFSILRYRTATVRIKEMTYIFAAITIALINSIITDKYDPVVILLSNVLILVTAACLEYFFIGSELQRTVLIEKIELIKPENEQLLLKDLSERMGLKIKRVEIGRVDFLRDIASVKIYYDK